MGVKIPITSEESLPSPPFVTVQGIVNFRDVASHPSIKRGVLYRCAEPSAVTQDGINTMNELGITHIYDLRSSTEIERSIASGRGGIAEWDGCKRIFAPVFTNRDYSPAALALRYKDYAESGSTEGFQRAYTSILENAGPGAYRTILLHLAHSPTKPLIVHCTAGKDRTGIICALVLSLCGLNDKEVADEYALTEIGLTKAWKEAVVQYLMANTSLKGNEEGARNMTGAKAENMLATMELIRENYGGAEGYMIQKCGLTKEEVEMIISNLVV